MPPTREQNETQLKAALERIADGEGYIQRMEELIVRATARSAETAELVNFLEDMRVVQVSFKKNRDVLLRAIEAADDPKG